MGWSTQYFQIQGQDTGHEFPLGEQGNTLHVPRLGVPHPWTDNIIIGHHVAPGNPITTEPVLMHPGTNREAATHS